jgi:hypothetical protein
VAAVAAVLTRGHRSLSINADGFIRVAQGPSGNLALIRVEDPRGIAGEGWQLVQILFTSVLLVGHQGNSSATRCGLSLHLIAERWVDRDPTNADNTSAQSARS